MPQSLARVIVHLIFSTKDRRPAIPTDVREELNAYIGGTLKNLDCYPLLTGCVADHVHALFCLSRTHAIGEVVREVKVESSKWMKSREAGFAWQNGYGIFSVSQSNTEAVREYILAQEQHHRRVSFQDEFRAFCKKHNVELDERYAWD